MLQFIEDIASKGVMVLLTRRLYASLHRIQRKLKDLIETRESKIDVLMGYWDKMEFTLALSAS